MTAAGKEHGVTPVFAAAGSFTSQHSTHLVAVAIPVAMVVVGLVADSVHGRRKRRRENGEARPVRQFAAHASIALRVAALASAGAAVVHLRVLPEHAAESAWYGAFFAAAALAQFGGSALLLRRAVSRRFVGLCAAGNVAVIALWLFTRLVAVPLGPSSGSAETFGALDVLASSFEAIVAAGCVAALWPRRVRRMRGIDGVAPAVMHAPARAGRAA